MGTSMGCHLSCVSQKKKKLRTVALAVGGGAMTV